MKKIIVITVFLLSSFFATSQETYVINGQSVELKSAVEGQLDLLWKIIDNQYHYFIRTDDNKLVELVNTQNADKKYQEEYKTALEQLTNNTSDLSNVNFTLPSLARFIEQYNGSVDPNYVSIHSKLDAEFRIGIFGGLTNSPFVGNPSNEKATVFGAELEMLAGKNKKHSGYFQLRHTSEKDDFKYKTTELSLGYRYRFVKTSSFSVYGDVKFATLNFSEASITYNNESDLVTEKIKETAFDLPLIFGIGADIRLSQVIYATVSYNQLFAVFLKNQGNFSSDITVGVKFKIN